MAAPHGTKLTEAFASAANLRLRSYAKKLSLLKHTVPKKQANPIDAQVGNRVRLRRMLIGMSQEKLGEALGLTFQQVQKYEKGVNRIGAGRLFQVARILGVPVTYFYEDVPREHGAPGFSESPANPPVIEFLASADGLHLSLAFMRIREPNVRKRVIDLVKSLADDEDAKG
ncbi:MAG: helix-turn-helix domain-containing protein [Rhizomicrobium sp.]